MEYEEETFITVLGGRGGGFLCVSVCCVHSFFLMEIGNIPVCKHSIML